MKTQDQQLLEEAYEETELNSLINRLFKQIGLRGEDYKEEFLKSRFKKNGLRSILSLKKN